MARPGQDHRQRNCLLVPARRRDLPVPPHMLGLRRLGFDVYYVEDSGRWIYDPRLNDISPDAGGNVAAVAEIFDAFGFRGRWAFRGNYPGGRCYGMEEAELLRLYR